MSKLQRQQQVKQMRQQIPQTETITQKKMLGGTCLKPTKFIFIQHIMQITMQKNKEKRRELPKSVEHSTKE